MSSSSSSVNWRMSGLSLGLVVGGVFAVLAVLAAPGAGLVLAAPLFISAGSGGWLFGPTAFVATNLGQLLRVLIALTGWVAFAGSMLLWLLIVAATAVGAEDLLGVSFGWGIWLGLVGVLALGLYALPFALVGAVIWAALLRRERHPRRS